MQHDRAEGTAIHEAGRAVWFPEIYEASLRVSIPSDRMVHKEIKEIKRAAENLLRQSAAAIAVVVSRHKNGIMAEIKVVVP